MLLSFILVFSNIVVGIAGEVQVIEEQKTGVFKPFNKKEENPSKDSQNKVITKIEDFEESKIITAAKGAKLENLELAKELIVLVDKSKTTISDVKWVSDPEYNEETPGLYIFTAELPKDYTLAEDLELPSIILFLKEDAKARMAHTGSAAKPLEITNFSQLKGFSKIINAGRALTVFGTEEVYLKLTKNIEAVATMEPIGNSVYPFKGHFDGNNNYISDISLHSNLEYAGLFGYIDSTGIAVENLSMVNFSFDTVNVAGALPITYAGGIAGVLKGATIQNCYVGDYAEKNASRQSGVNALHAGGVVGKLDNNGKILNSYSRTKVLSTTATVGFVGEIAGIVANASSIEASYSTSMLEINPSGKLGGIAGEIDASSKIENCFVIADVYAHLGGLPADRAKIATGTGTFSGNFVFDDINFIDTIGGIPTVFPAGTATDENGENKSAAELQAPSNYPSSFHNLPWEHYAAKLPRLTNLAAQNYDMPSYVGKGTHLFLGNGTAASPFLIETLENFTAFANIIDSTVVSDQTTYNSNAVYYELRSDIIIPREYIVKPVGTYTNNFKANFNGNGKTINKVITPDYNNISTEMFAGFIYIANGIFGYADGGTIENLQVDIALKDIANTGPAFIYDGGLVGYIKNGTIKNCTVRGSIEREITAYDGNVNSYVGGIAGYAVNTNISKCSVNASLLGSENLGGIAGLFTEASAALTDNTLEECYASVNFGKSEDYPALKFNNIGGIVGTLKKNESNSAIKLLNNHSKVDVYGPTDSVLAKGTNIGGIVGSLTIPTVAIGSNEVFIEQNYSEGTLVGNNTVGGIVGSASGSLLGINKGQLYLTSNFVLNKVIHAELFYPFDLIGDIDTSNMLFTNTNNTAFNNVKDLLGNNVLSVYPITRKSAVSFASTTSPAFLDASNARWSSPWAYTNGTLPVLNLNYTIEDRELPEYIKTSNNYFAGLETKTSPFLIETAEDIRTLKKVIEDPTLTSTYNSNITYYIVMEDIAIEQQQTNSQIGTETLPFKANFDGNSKTIELLQNSNQSDSAVTGLFGALDYAKVYDLNVKINYQYAAVPSAPGYFGTIAATAKNNTTIENCNVEVITLGDNAILASQLSVGGLVGYLKNSNLKNCSFIGTISSDYGNVGGLVAVANNSIITSCYSNGSLSSSAEKVGGIVGTLENGSQVRTSYSKMKAQGNKEVGGIAGYMDYISQVYYSYSTGFVSGDSEIGGIVGKADNGATIMYNAALNEAVLASTANVGRISGTSSTRFSSNYAFYAMEEGSIPFPVGEFSADKLNGENLGIAGIADKATWELLGFDTVVWNIDDSKLPTLLDISVVQEQEIDFHLTGFPVTELEIFPTGEIIVEQLPTAYNFVLNASGMELWTYNKIKWSTADDLAWDYTGKSTSYPIAAERFEQITFKIENDNSGKSTLGTIKFKVPTPLTFTPQLKQGDSQVIKEQYISASPV